jgi:hypothetical protein|tara:strand:- start:2693 stop:2887 length:195 start_codon:yes stop_codon:yes gene_type:complete
MKDRDYVNINPMPYKNIIHDCSDMLMSLSRHMLPIIEELDGDEFELTDGEILVTITKINKRKRY